MDVQVTDHGGHLTLELREHPAIYRIGLTEHGLRDIEFALAQRRAVTRRCTETRGEHSCALAPGHGGAQHLCRACTVWWPRS